MWRSNVNFRDKRVSFGEWDEVKPALFEKYPVAVLPFIETEGGQYFGATVSLLRIWAKNLGKLYSNIEILTVVIIWTESIYLLAKVKSYIVAVSKQEL